MTSKSRRQGPTHPRKERVVEDTEKRRPGREATVYDAVAGRCSSQRFIPPTPYTSSTRDVPTSSTLPVPPEEVLFRRLGAPERDIHDDFYWADRHLTEKQTLPESDLLSAVHTYTADFYGAMAKKGEVMLRSMDETALLAVGILLEEAAEEILGETGDMVFVEGEATEEPERQGHKNAGSSEVGTAEDGEQRAGRGQSPGVLRSMERPSPKRRKTKHKGKAVAEDP